MSESLTPSVSYIPIQEPIVLKTESVLRSFDIQWQVNNFSFIQKDLGEFIESSKFTIGANPRTDCVLRLYPNGSETEGEVSVFFVNLCKCVTHITFTLSILDAEGQKRHSCKSGFRKVVCDSDWGFPRFIARSELLKEESKLIHNDTLTIIIELKALESVADSCAQGLSGVSAKLSEDLGKLFSSSDSSDITITVAGKKFQAHKCILSARSPVFAAMFNSGLEESRSDAVDIPDVDPDVMEELLRYIYTGRCNKMDEMAGELLRVSDKYDVSGMKEDCVSSLLKQINSENAADTLIIADSYNARDLKEKTLDFIKKNSRKVVVSVSWQNMTELHPHLEVEALRAIAYRRLHINT